MGKPDKFIAYQSAISIFICFLIDCTTGGSAAAALVDGASAGELAASTATPTPFTAGLGGQTRRL